MTGYRPPPNDPQPSAEQVRRSTIAALRNEWDALQETASTIADRHPGGWVQVHQRLTSVAAALDEIDAQGSRDRRPPFSACRCSRCAR